MSTKVYTTSDYDMALKLTKAKIGISSTVRDDYLTAIVKGVASELRDINGIDLDFNISSHLMYIVDLSVHRYQNHDDKFVPINLQRRLHELILMYKKKDIDSNVE